MQIETYELPDFWAPALINGDPSNLSDADEKALDKWLTATFPDGAHCLTCSDDEGNFMRYHDASRFVLACNCLTFAFDVGGR